MNSDHKPVLVYRSSSKWSYGCSCCNCICFQ